ncbi:MAG TPA: hypothetical protein VKU36_02370 [Candidatus Babeliales bacterium]|nr:hypothetical protein [Candidatus Babeliales bacterium]
MKRILFYFLILNAPITYNMYLKNLSACITFNKQRKQISDWLLNHRDEEFGDTYIITLATPSFTEKNIINHARNLQNEEMLCIHKGHALYCPGIKKKNGIQYGAIILAPQLDAQFLAKPEITKIICHTVRLKYQKKESSSKPKKSESYPELHKKKPHITRKALCKSATV